MAEAYNINWNIKTPFNDRNARYYDRENDKLIKIPNTVLNQRIKGFRNGDKIIVLYGYNVDEKILFTEPIGGHTLKSFLKAIERGVNRIIKNDNFETQRIVYGQIAMFGKESKRLELVNKFERGNLKIKDLIGDHCAFSGSLQRFGTTWSYGLDS